jgi:phosphohistidine phosphatase
MRHANAQWKDSQMADFDRPLNRRGQAEAEAVSRRLAVLQLVPALLIASAALRTQQTAEIVSHALGLASRQVRSEERLYLASAGEIMSIVQSTGPRIPHLMIIGHNPGISELAKLLSPESSMPELATASVRSLTFDARTWAGVSATTLRDWHSETPPAGLFRMWA